MHVAGKLRHTQSTWRSAWLRPQQEGTLGGGPCFLLPPDAAWYTRPASRLGLEGGRPRVLCWGVYPVAVLCTPDTPGACSRTDFCFLQAENQHPPVPRAWGGPLCNSPSTGNLIPPSFWNRALVHLTQCSPHSHFQGPHTLSPRERAIVSVPNFIHPRTPR